MKSLYILYKIVKKAAPKTNISFNELEDEGMESVIIIERFTETLK